MSANSESHAMKSWFETLFPNQYESLSQFLEPGFKYTTLSEEGIQSVAGYGANAVFTSWIVCAGLIIFALLAKKSLGSVLQKEGVERYFADSSLSIRNIWEMYVSFILDLGGSVMDKSETKKLFWLFGGLFIYVFTSNITGILPGGTPPSQDISNNFSMAIVVLIIFTFVGFARQGVGFIKHMCGPVWYLAPLILLIELFSTFIVRPGSLSLRLGGNMTGDHTVLGITYQFLEYGLPVVALGLGTFVSFVQAFVFTLLTMIYIVLSIGDGDHH
jgi:F-type H+-transporting ATPase subunit a